eukprot:14660979-Alexandrium_andersonii.AAC.1
MYARSTCGEGTPAGPSAESGCQRGQALGGSAGTRGWARGGLLRRAAHAAEQVLLQLQRGAHVPHLGAAGGLEALEPALQGAALRDLRVRRLSAPGRPQAGGPGGSAALPARG